MGKRKAYVIIYLCKPIVSLVSLVAAFHSPRPCSGTFGTPWPQPFSCKLLSRARVQYYKQWPQQQSCNQIFKEITYINNVNIVWLVLICLE